jgi:hypothetical protein
MAAAHGGAVIEIQDTKQFDDILAKHDKVCLSPQPAGLAFQLY